MIGVYITLAPLVPSLKSLDVTIVCVNVLVSDASV